MCYYWNIRSGCEIREICDILRYKTRCILWNQKWNMMYFCETICEIFTWNILCYFLSLFCVIFHEICCEILLFIISKDILCYLFPEYFIYLTYFSPGPNVSIIAHISQYFTLYFTTAPVCRRGSGAPRAGHCARVTAAPGRPLRPRHGCRRCRPRLNLKLIRWSWGCRPWAGPGTGRQPPQPHWCGRGLDLKCSDRRPRLVWALSDLTRKRPPQQGQKPWRPAKCCALSSWLGGPPIWMSGPQALETTAWYVAAPAPAGHALSLADPGSGPRAQGPPGSWPVAGSESGWSLSPLRAASGPPAPGAKRRPRPPPAASVRSAAAAATVTPGDGLVRGPALRRPRQTSVKNASGSRVLELETSSLPRPSHWWSQSRSQWRFVHAAGRPATQAERRAPPSWHQQIRG